MVSFRFFFDVCLEKDLKSCDVRCHYLLASVSEAPKFSLGVEPLMPRMLCLYLKKLESILLCSGRNRLTCNKTNFPDLSSFVSSFLASGCSSTAINFNLTSPCFNINIRGPPGAYYFNTCANNSIFNFSGHFI